MTCNIDAQQYTDYSEILVKISSEKQSDALEKLLEGRSLNIKQLFKKNSKNINSVVKIWNIYSVQLNYQDNGATIDMLLRSNIVEWAHYRSIPELLFIPNDPLLSEQYYLDKINSFKAWEISMGNETVIVGVVDTGIDTSHIELISQISYNQADTINGIDDDFDGFIDNYYGWNIAENNNDVSANINPHGVGVAGIVAAKANNGVGISGVAPGIKILPVKIMNNRGQLRSAYEGVVYAAEHGCKIIVCSWGSVIPDNFGRDVIRYVTDELKSLVIAAAGNSRNENIYYPASYNGVISVMATNSFDHIWAGSTLGYRIDVAAPGQDIISTDFGGGYGVTSGSSNAAPIVAGVAAAILAQRPGLNALQVAAQIKATSYWLDTIAANMLYANKMGAGRVDMLKALSDTNAFYIETPYRVIVDGVIKPNQSYRLEGNLVNLLQHQNGVMVTISPLSDYISITNNSFTVNSWDAGLSVDLENYNIRLNCDSRLPNDLIVPLRFSYSASGKTHHVIRTLETHHSWRDLDRFDLKMTLSATGKPAYTTLSPLTGKGFRKGGSNTLLWEAGLIVGVSEHKVVNSLSGSSDFSPQTVVEYIDSDDIESAIARFSDRQSPNSLKLDYMVKVTTGNNYPLSSALVYEVTVTNSSIENIENLRIGLFTNWLVRSGAVSITNFPLQLSITTGSYAYPYAHGVAVITPSQSFNNYSFDTGTIPQGLNITDDFSTYEMWLALNSSREQTDTLQKGTPANLISTAIDFLPATESRTVTFAFFTDSHQEQIEQHALVLRDYLFLQGEVSPQVAVFYPNPAGNVFYFSKTVTELSIFDLLGHKVFESREGVSCVNIDNWLPGVYLLVYKCDDVRMAGTLLKGVN